MRDKLIEGGYFLPLIFAIILTMIIGTASTQTQNEVRRFCIKIDIQHPEIVTAQSVLESGHYSCSNCSLDHNNIFGFRWKGEYLEFGHWMRSVYYYRWWQRKHYSGGDYYEFLEGVGYATSKTYISKLKQL